MRRRVWMVAALLLAGCGDGGPGRSEPETPPAFPPTATSRAGMVVTGSSYATEAGRRMLAQGGNAVDAAVAAAFALAVVEPTQSGLGGRTQILVRLADGSVEGVDGTTQVPAGYDPAGAPEGELGHAAVAIPGTVAALTAVHEAHGSLPLATVMAPAVTWAREGFVLSEGVARRLAELAPLDPATEVARRFTDGGRLLAAGTRLRQVDVAGVLERIARDGRSGFYTGPVAERLAEDMAEHGGFVTLADLAAYRAASTPVGRTRYGGYEIVGSYLPASGVTVAQALAILARLDVPDDDVAWTAVVSEALVAAFEDRETAEALAPGRAVAWLTSDSLADRRAAEVTARLATHAIDVGPARSPAASVGAGAFDRDLEPAFTSHISVADTLGNLVALTQSLGPTGGARVVTPGLGFLYASTLGGYLTGGGPGYRPWSSQAPLVVLRDGRPALVMGGAGARRILSALVSTLSRVVDHGTSLEVALAAPRFHPTGGTILVEEGWPGMALLEGAGYRVEARERDYYARLNVLQIRPDGTFVGVGEPRWAESAAAGPEG